MRVKREIYSMLQMKKIFALSFIVLGPIFGQELEQPSPLESAVVLDEVIFHNGKSRLVVQRVDEPELKKGQSAPVEPPPESLRTSPEDVLPTQTFLIVSTTYSNLGTYFELWPASLGKQASLSGWSNLDWSIFQPVHKFTDGQHNFQFMQFHSKIGDAEIARRKKVDNQGGGGPQLPTTLPSLTETGGRYLVTSPEETEREDTMDFLEALHKLYDERSQELADLREAREERRHQMQMKAEQPKDRVLRVWRRSIKE